MTALRRTVLVAALFGTQAVIGCASLGRQTPAVPASARAWPTTLLTARTQAAEGRYDAADSILADFATRFPATPEALETAYWRGIFKIEPANVRGSLTGGLALLDAYLGDPRPREHVVEATAIRHIAAQLDGATRTVANAMAQAKDATVTAANANARAADANARAEAKPEVPPSLESEIKRLKDELAKANAELDRIRKRLAQPPPGKP